MNLVTKGTWLEINFKLKFTLYLMFAYKLMQIVRDEFAFRRWLSSTTWVIEKLGLLKL